MKSIRIPDIMAVFAVFLFMAVAGPAFAVTVTKDEAVAVAEYWMASEIDSPYSKLSESEKSDKLPELAKYQVLYLVSKDGLVEELTSDMTVLAYVIKYPSGGYVVVSGDDRLNPVIAFDINAEFRWDEPKLNFMRGYLGKTMVSRWQYMEARKAAGEPLELHQRWAGLRTVMRKGLKPLSLSPAGVYVLWDTPLWGQDWPYNTRVVSSNGFYPHIPTGCTATAMAMLMKFHSWPLIGSGAFSYNDTWGSIMYSHSVDFGNRLYYWANMPSSSLTSINSHVAGLMYDCGVAVCMDYEIGSSRAWPSADSMNTFFRYKGTVEQTSNHEPAMIYSIMSGLPVIMCTSDHAVLACGYRDSPYPYFYLNCGWNGNSNGWYDINTDVPGRDDHTIDRSYPYCSPGNYFYVDGTWVGNENGTLSMPYNTLSEGNTNMVLNGHLLLKGVTYTGSGNVPCTLDKRMVIRTYMGTATVTDRMKIAPEANIKLTGGAIKLY